MRNFRKTLILIIAMLLFALAGCFFGCNKGQNNNVNNEEGDYGQIVEQIDNTKISYALNDFETVSSLYKCKIDWKFGKISQNSDKQYVTSGSYSAKIDVNQDGTTRSTPKVTMPFYSNGSSLDISRLKDFSFDVYNASSESKNLSVSLTVGTYTSEKDTFILTPGWNHIMVEPDMKDLEKRTNLTEGQSIIFYFDRPNEIGYETYYFDNIIINNRNYENFETLSAIDETSYKISNGEGQVVLSDNVSYKGKKSLEFKNNQSSDKSAFIINFNEDQLAVIRKGGAVRFYFKVVKEQTCSASVATINLLVDGNVARNVASNYALTNSQWVYANLTTGLENCKSIALSIILNNYDNGAGYSLFIDELSIAEKATYEVVYYKESETINEYQVEETIVREGYVGDYTETTPIDYNGYVCQPISEQTIKTNNTKVEVKYYNKELGVPYRINHHLAYSDNEANGYFLDESYDVLRGVVGADTQAVARDYIGYYSNVFEQQTILDDGSTCIDIYYSRDMLVEGFETFELENNLMGEVYDSDLRIKYYVDDKEVSLFGATTGLKKPSASIVSDAHSGNKSLMYSNNTSTYIVWFNLSLNAVQKQALKEGKVVSFWYKIESTVGQDVYLSTILNGVDYKTVSAKTNAEWQQVYLYNQYLDDSISFKFSGSSGLSGFNIYFDDIAIVDVPEISYTVNHILNDGDAENVISTETKSGELGKLTNATIDNSYQVGDESIVNVDGVYYAVRYINQEALTEDNEIIINVYYDKLEGMAYKVVHKLALSSNEADGYFTEEGLIQWLGGTIGEKTNAHALNINGYTAKPYEQQVIKSGAETVVEIEYERDMLVEGVEVYEYCQEITDYEDIGLFDRKFKIDGEYIPYYVTTGMKKPTLSISSESHSGNKSIAYTCTNSTSQIWIKIQLNREQIASLEHGELSFWYKIVTTTPDARKTIRSDISNFTVSGGVYDFITATNNSEWVECVLTKDMVDSISGAYILSWHLQECDGTIIYVDDIVVKDERPSYKVNYYKADANGEYTILFDSKVLKVDALGDESNIDFSDIVETIDGMNYIYSAVNSNQVVITENGQIIDIYCSLGTIADSFENLATGVADSNSFGKLEGGNIYYEAGQIFQKAEVTTASAKEGVKSVRYYIYNSASVTLKATMNAEQLSQVGVNDTIKLSFKWVRYGGSDTAVITPYIGSASGSEIAFITPEHGVWGTLAITGKDLIKEFIASGGVIAFKVDLTGSWHYVYVYVDSFEVEKGEPDTSAKYTVNYLGLDENGNYTIPLKNVTLGVDSIGDQSDIDFSDITVTVDGIKYVYSVENASQVEIVEDGQVVDVNYKLTKIVDSFDGLTAGAADKGRFGKLEGGNIYYEGGAVFQTAEVVGTFGKDGTKSVNYYIYNSASVTLKATMSAEQLSQVGANDTIKLSFLWIRNGGSDTAVITPYIGSASGSQLTFSTPEHATWGTLTISGKDKIEEFIASGGAIAFKVDLTGGWHYVYVYVDSFEVEKGEPAATYTVNYYTADENGNYTILLKNEMAEVGKLGEKTNIDFSDITTTVNGIKYVYAAEDARQVEIVEDGQVVDVNYKLVKVVDSFEGLTAGAADKGRFGKLEGGNIYYEAAQAWQTAEVVGNYGKDGSKSVRYYIYNSASVTLKATMSAEQLSQVGANDTIKLSFLWIRNGGSDTAVITPYIGSASGSQLTFSTPEHATWGTLTISGKDKIEEFIASGGAIAFKVDLTGGWHYVYVYVDSFEVEKGEPAATYTVNYYTADENGNYTILLKNEMAEVGKLGEKTNIDFSDITTTVNGIKYVYAAEDARQVEIVEDGQVVDVNYKLVKVVDSFEGLTAGAADKGRFGKLEGGNIYYEAAQAWQTAEVVGNYGKDGSKSVRYYIYNSASVTLKATMSAEQLSRVSVNDTIKLSFYWIRNGGSATATITPYIGAASGTQLTFTTPEHATWGTLTISGKELVEEFIASGGVIAFKVDIAGSWQYIYVYVDTFEVEKGESIETYNVRRNLLQTNESIAPLMNENLYIEERDAEAKIDLF